MTLSSLHFPAFKLFFSKRIAFSYSVYCGHLVLNLNRLFTRSLSSSFHYYLKYLIFHPVSKASLQIKATVIFDKILYYEFLNYSSDFVFFFSTTLPYPFSPVFVIKNYPLLQKQVRFTYSFPPIFFYTYLPFISFRPLLHCHLHGDFHWVPYLKTTAVYLCSPSLFNF